MNWYRHPATIDRLAAEYVLGSLHGRARRRFEQVMAAHPALTRAVISWQEKLHPLDQALPAMKPSAAAWDRIAARSFGTAQAATAKPSWWQRLLAPVPAGALALGLLVGGVVPQMLLGPGTPETQLPESYVGVLATADGRTGLIVSSLRREKVVDLKRVSAVPTPAGQTLYLWTIEDDGGVRPVGAVPDGAFVSIELAADSETTFRKARELALSHEAIGSRPAQPSGAFVYRGLCGKLWKLKPAS